MRFKLFTRSFPFLLFLLFQFCSTGVSAQDSTPVDSSGVNQPKAISLVNLSKATERIRADVSLARSRMASEKRILEIDSTYSDFSDDIDIDKATYVEFRKVTPNRQKLDNMIHKWNSYSTRLDAWQKTLNGYQVRNAATLNTLGTELQSWRLTADAAINDNVPVTVSESISKSNQDLEDVIADLRSQNNRVLALETRIVEQKHDIKLVVDDLGNWIQSGELNLLYRRHEPIWSIDFSRTPEEKAKRGQNNIKEVIKTFPKYFKIYEENMYVILLALAIIIGLVYYLKNRLGRYEISEEQRELRRMKAIISHNALATVFFLVFLLEIIFLDNMPELLYELFTVGMLITALILFRPFALPAFRWIIVFIAISFILDALKSYFWFTSANYRLYMYLESFLIVAVIFYCVKEVRKMGDDKLNKIGSLIYKLLPLIAIAVLIAITANTLGYTNLSDLMLKICTQGAVITVIAYGILMVLGGIVSALIIMHFERIGNYNRAYKAYLLKRAGRLVYLFAIVFWIGFFLTSAELYRPIMGALELWLSEPWVFGETSVKPGNVLSFLTVLTVTFIITRFIATIVRGGAMDALKMPRGVPNAISLVIRYIIIVFGIFLSLGSLGVDLTGFSLMAGALGVGIGFGLQNIISNFVAGIILTFERPIQSGDTIEVGTVFGVVQKIGVRSSSVRSFDGADIAVPNNTLLSNDLINWTQSDLKKRMDIRVGVSYDSDPNVVLEILKDIAVKSKHTVADPPPMALFNEFGDSSLNFRLLFWIPVDDVLSAKSDVSIEIYNRFKEAGIVIPFPQRDINIIEQKED